MLDPNVVISGLLSAGGAPAQVLRRSRTEPSSWSSPTSCSRSSDSAGLATESNCFRLELDMAIRARKPGVVLFDGRYRRRLRTPPELHALQYDPQEVSLAKAAPGWRKLEAYRDGADVVRMSWTNATCGG